ncbi:MAG: protoporphyrinogen oxidase [Candidatus Marinimicrobia bacterium]|nr:protoporphyrinogen oxidase [Candidatus Neomarinimicrobiota bacterium]
MLWPKLLILMAKNVAIIGGGIAGLTAAYYLKKSGITPTVFEASSQLGGVIQSDTIDGFTIENGPNTLLLSDQRTVEMFDDLGLQFEDASPNSKNRYVVKDKQLVAVPMSIKSFITTSLFSWTSKFKIITEAFRQNKPLGDEESVSQFIIRRFGKEVLVYAVNPFIAGTYAGDPDSLSIEHSFPLLENTERVYGSVIGGFFKNRKKQNPHKIKRRTISFPKGVAELTHALSNYLSDSTHLNTTISDISKTDNSFTLTNTQNGKMESSSFDEIICTVPTYSLKNITINGEDYPDFDELGEINYPPVISISLGYKKEHIPHSLEGFGALVPKCENMNILGVLFSSSLFNNRAPKDHSLLTVFIGGSRQPELTVLSEIERVQLAKEDLETLLGISTEPAFMHQTLWKKAIPQYHVGYGHYKSIMNMIEAKLRGFHFAGNYVNGISIQDTILSSMNLVNELNRHSSTCSE